MWRINCQISEAKVSSGYAVSSSYERCLIVLQTVEAKRWRERQGFRTFVCFISYSNKSTYVRGSSEGTNQRLMVGGGGCQNPKHGERGTEQLNNKGCGSIIQSESHKVTKTFQVSFWHSEQLITRPSHTMWVISLVLYIIPSYQPLSTPGRTRFLRYTAANYKGICVS